jgi:uncharacterized protein (DUF1330 family)
MSAYLNANVKGHDDAWIPEYAQKVRGFVPKYGGKYLSRSGNLTPIEGELPDNTVSALIEFPSVAAVCAFVNDSEYAPLARARQAGTDSTFYAIYTIDDIDLARGVPYLPPG